MSILSRLFGGGGGGASKEPEAQVYKGFAITPTPINEGNVFRISARIEKEVGGEAKSHTLIRADTLAGLEAAQEASIAKAKQLIDQSGERLFG